MHELLFSILNLFVLYPVSCCRYFMCVVSKVVRAYVSDSLGLHVISFRRRKKIKKIKKLYLVTAGFFILFVTRPLLAEAAVTSDKGKQGSEGSLKDDLAYIKDWISRDKQLVIPAKAAKPVRKTVKKAPIIAEQPIVQTKPISYSQSQKAMLGSLPELQSDSDENAGAAFNGLVKESMPLTPRQVVKLRQLIDQSQRAAVIPPTIPPKPISSTVMINLAPGATPPAIRLAQGYVTSLVFVDSAGSPWPVASYDIGNIKSTSIQWDGKGNILLVQAATPYGDSDIVIRLKGLATPVTLELVSGQRVVDYRTDIHVPGFGPNSKDLPIGTGVPLAANPTLLSVLDGVAPAGSNVLTVRGGGDCSAWAMGEKMFVRTRMTILSPGWTGRMASPDGMYAYEMLASSSILVSQHGEPVELKIEGF